MQRILAADTVGHGFNKAFEYSNMTLAGVTPIAILSPKTSYVRHFADLALGVAIPLHMHIATNSVVSDYIPRAYRLPVRSGVLAMTALTYLGIMKVNMAGPGLTECVKMLWHRPPKEPKA